jgi:heme oxygenase
MSSSPELGAKTSGGDREASPLRQRLKRETSGLHRRLEEQLGLLDPALSRHRYSRVLQIFYGYYAPLEAHLVRLTASGPPMGFLLQTRSELLERDLLALGMTRRELAELPRCAELPGLSCLEHLAGCLYVLEGASLGGQVIAPILHQRLGVAQGRGASFFVGDAEATPARWRLVLTWLDGLVGAGAGSEEIVGSAYATFLTLVRWVEQQNASQRAMREGNETPWPT